VELHLIEVFGMSSPNVTKITIALEEIGQPYEFHTVDIWKGQQFADDFARLNPNRRVPIIVDPEGPDGKEIVIFESGAILLYLAEKFGLLLPSEPRARLVALQWMMVQMTGVGPMFGQFVHFSTYAPEGNEYALDRYKSEVVRLYKLLEDRLSESEHVGGDAYSLADVATIPWVLNPLTATERVFGDVSATHPNLLRWVATVQGRPAVQRALALTAKLRAALTKYAEATPEERDRLFGRGHFSRARGIGAPDKK
jgi:GSH-dependent disulfide-bond oxidoreductase